MKPIPTFSLSLFFSLFSMITSIHAQCDNDTTPPIFHTVSLSTAVVPESHQVTLYAIDFYISASDDCTISDSLRYTFTTIEPENDNNFVDEFNSSKMHFDCNDVVNSPILVDLYVWDLVENRSKSSVYLTLVNTSSDSSCDGCDEDTEHPLVQMVPSLTWVYPPDADSIDVWASDFVWAASDNCTGPDLIKFSFTPVSPWDDPSASVKYFDCNDVMNSPFEVDIYIWDRQGNYAMGQSTFNLQNQPGEDCSTNNIKVEGQVVNLHGEPMEGVAIFLERESGEILDDKMTDELGNYSFFTNPVNKYLRVEYEDSTAPEMTLLDMIALQKFLLGLTTFSTPQQLASDINSDGKIRVNDLRMMRKYILGVNNPNDQINSDWHFVDQNHDMGANGTNISRIAIGGDNGSTIVGYRLGDLK